MEKRYDFANCLSITAAEILYSLGVKTIVTDGKYVQVDPEEFKEDKK